MQIKNRQTLLTVVAGTGLALLILDSLIVTPLIHTWKKRQQQIADLQDQVDKGQKLLDRRDAILNGWKRICTNTLPGDTTLAANEIYKAFERWSQDSHITISSLKPQWKPSVDDNYTTLECRADASGNIEMLSRFIYEAEKDTMALKVEAVEIQSHDTNGQQLTLGLQVSGLLLNPQQ
jgi:hypothetical protein